MEQKRVSVFPLDYRLYACPKNWDCSTQRSCLSVFTLLQFNIFIVISVFFTGQIKFGGANFFHGLARKSWMLDYFFGRTFIFRTDKYRIPGLFAYIFGVFSNFGRTDFYGRIKDSPSAQEPLDVEKTFKTFN